MTLTQAAGAVAPSSAVVRKPRQAMLLIDGDIHPSYNTEQMSPWVEDEVLQRIREFGLHAHGEAYLRGCGTAAVASTRVQPSRKAPHCRCSSANCSTSTRSGSVS